MKKMTIAVIGQGRSGKDIHCKYFFSELNQNTEVKYIVEEIKERREIAKEEYGCEVFENYTELFGKTDIDLVVNASYSEQHYIVTKDLLEHGFNVLVEKPFSRTYFECQDLINTAKKNNVTVVAFHQSLFAPSYLKVKEFITSGKLGEIFQISLKYSGYSRRWDWQTLQKCCGGSVYNSGPHPIGQALDLLGWDKNIRVEFSDLRTLITSGDAEDYGKIILACPNRPNVDIEICSVDAYANDFVFKIFGTKGTLCSTNSHYKVKYTDLDKYEKREVIEGALHDEKWSPLYCVDKLDFIEEEADITGSSFDLAVKDFYDMVYGAVMEGKPMSITPDMAAEVIRIIETTHSVNPLEVKF